MSILITGDRNYSDIKTIETSFNAIKDIFSPDSTTVIHGGCRGADTLSGDIAIKKGYKVKVFSAEWDKYGKGAGPIRNKQMVSFHSDVVLIFHNDLKNSRGTKNCVKLLLDEINKSNQVNKSSQLNKLNQTSKYNPIILLNSKVINKDDLEKIIT